VFGKEADAKYVSFLLGPRKGSIISKSKQTWWFKRAIILISSRHGGYTGRPVGCTRE